MPFLALTLVVVTAGPAKPDAGTSWVGEAMPLQLVVRTPEDITFKAAAEKQYLLFNLLVGGKVAWDRGDYQDAATKWESLLRTPGVPTELVTLVTPLVKESRARAGGAAPSPLPIEPQVTMTPMEPEPAPAKVAPTTFPVSGVVQGGGSHGPGGAVLVLRPTDRPTPKPRSQRVRAVVQKDKRFVPHVLAIPLGATVEFKNEDAMFHNVFSLSKQNEFDLGYAGGGALKEQVFAKPGPVHLLCNIHSQMNGWLYVSDSPWFAQAGADGKFTLKNVPPGTYELEVWHEWASATVKQTVKVAGPVSDLSLTVDGDKRAPAFQVDKAGKERQPQLGY